MSDPLKNQSCTFTEHPSSCTCGVEDTKSHDENVSPEDSASQVSVKSKSSTLSKASSRVSSRSNRSNRSHRSTGSEASTIKERLEILEQQEKLEKVKLDAEEVKAQADRAKRRADPEVAQHERRLQFMVENSSSTEVASQLSNQSHRIKNEILRPAGGTTDIDHGTSQPQGEHRPPVLPATPKRSTELDPMSRSFNPRTSTPHMTSGLPPVTCPAVADTTQVLNATCQALLESQRRQTLPPTTIPRFGGDVTMFRRFMDAFNYGICNKTSDYAERLNYLDQYLTGDAKTLISSCRLNADPSIGYHNAIILLERQYGSNFDLCNAYLSRIRLMSKIKSKDDERGLREYVMLMRECESAMVRINGTAQMESPMNMALLISKLPEPLSSKWYAKILEHKEATGNTPPFRYFVAFLDHHANIAKIRKDYNEFSGIPVCDAKKDTKREEKATTLLTKEETNPKDKCSYCAQDHLTRECPRLRKKTISQTRSFITDRHLCYKCLEDDHIAEKCDVVVTCAQCGKSHASVCHFENFRKKWGPSSGLETGAKASTETVLEGVGMSVREATTAPASDVRAVADVPPREEAPTHASSESTSCLSEDQESKTMLPIRPVRVHTPGAGKSEVVWAIWDICSTRSYALKSLAQHLGVNGSTAKEINVKTVAGARRCNKVLQGIQMSNLEGESPLKLSGVYLIDELPVSTSDMGSQKVLERWPHLQGLDLCFGPDRDRPVELLIGGNNPGAHIIKECIASQDNGPNAYRTDFGWILSGPTGDLAEAEETEKTCLINTRQINQHLESHFNREFNELEVECKEEFSGEDKLFLKKMEQSLKFDDGHYSVGLPFRDESPLPNNEFMARKRLDGLKKKLLNDETYRTEYVKAMEELISDGYAEPVPDDELDRRDGRVWVIPHFGVKHPSKPGVVRIVHDCAARYQGCSLNDKLLPGPDLTSSLTGVILRFRNGKIGMKSDIKQMFFQVKVPAVDRDVLRFLWWPNGDLNLPPKMFRMTVHAFGLTSSPSCVNFVLRRLADDGQTLSNVLASEALRRNCYMDDLMKALEEEQEAVTFHEEVADLGNRGGFSFVKWASNDSTVLHGIPIEKRAASVKTLCIDDKLPSEKVLGLDWCLESDTLGYKVNVKEKPFTRRGILSTVASVYDPLGLAGPVILVAKKIIQSLCRDGHSWDDDLDLDRKRSWDQWVGELPLLEKLRIDRSFVPNGFGKVVSYQLHHFCDASEIGYGTVSYLRVVNDVGDVHCTLLMCKARVSPLKPVTIPRLELTAARTAVRIDQLLRRELDLQLLPSIFWTDSTAVLKYLRNEKARYHTFVANRVSLIRELSSVDNWRYVDTSLNPADMASRGLRIAEFLTRKDWISGPTFLRESEEFWPRLPEDVIAPTLDGDREVRSDEPCLLACERGAMIEEILERFSDWDKAIRVLCLVFKFGKKRALPDSHQEEGCDPDELNHIENKVLKIVQAAHFSKEIALLKRNPSAQMPKSSKLAKLNPILDEEGMLRVGSRIANPTPISNKHQILLPKDSQASLLLMRRQHELMGHCGRNHLLATVRGRFWILRAGVLARGITSRCTECRRLAARTIAPQMSTLPLDRTTPAKPFENTGVDYFGPFHIARKAKRKTVDKYYGVVFTCLASRAVHIEVAQSLEAASFVNALRRFVSRRGPVSVMRSDNGTNFVGAERELKEELERLESDELRSYIQKSKMKWVFNPPSASHFGGVWERVIRSVRRVLTALTRLQTLDYEGLITFMCETEAILNSRPLTRPSEDHLDEEPLTPNHLLNHKGSPVSPGVFEKADLFAKNYWRQSQYMADLFWKRWTAEYLPILQERSKWNSACRNLAVGDVVLIVDGDTPRSSWPMGRVMEVSKGRDGFVRSASVKTAYGRYTRPVHKLCMLLECEEVPTEKVFSE